MDRLNWMGRGGNRRYLARSKGVGISRNGQNSFRRRSRAHVTYLMIKNLRSDWPQPQGLSQLLTGDF